MKDLIQNKKLVIVLFAVILFLGSALRLWQLGKVPLSPDWDEVALGYSAYSIATTGMDEFGKSLPIVLKSFNDYKPALYSYLIIPFYKIFGLSVFAIRLPSAIFGILTIFAVYFLVKKLFARNDIALLTSFMLAISPWHIQFSRVAFEANVGLALNIFAATFLLYAIKKPWFLLCSALFAGLSIYVYQSEKVFTPLLILGLVIIFAKPLFKLPKKYLFSSVILGIIVVLPMLSYILTDNNALARAAGTSIFSNQTALLSNNAQKTIYDIKTNNVLGKVFDNRRIVYAITIINGYLSHFNPNWLLNGDLSRHHAPDMGLIYLWEFPFIAIGIYSLLFSNYDKKTKITVFFWFLLAPLPASITNDVPHAVRTLNFLPTWQIFTAIGIVGFITWTKKLNLGHKMYDFRRIIFVLGLTCYFLLSVVNFAYYLDQYFVQQNYFNAVDWQFGYEKIVDQVKRIGGNYKKIVVSDRRPLMDESYMFFLFYLQYPPRKYQEVSRNLIGSSPSHFGKYEFRHIDKGEVAHSTSTLFVGLPDEFLKSANIIYTSYYPNGKPAMVLATQ